MFVVCVTRLVALYPASRRPPAAAAASPSPAPSSSAAVAAVPPRQRKKDKHATQKGGARAGAGARGAGAGAGARGAGAGGAGAGAATARPGRPPRKHGGGGGGGGGGKGTFLTPMDLSYKSLLASAYAGFYVDPPSALPDTLHHRVRKALHDLTRRGFFTFDVLQTNSAVSCTFVRRTLVGDLGSTYHYQGLRLFAHPWVGKHGGAAAPSLRVVSDLNDTLKRVAQPHLAAEARRLPAGRPTTSTEWSVSLINFMDPDDPLAPALREEPAYGMGRTSVSWHSDSSLQPNSTIAVYHCTAAASDWRVGLRCLGTAAADVPAVRLPLADQSTYFMCSDFNDTHHHAVLTGTTARYSSTHRVAVTKTDTLPYIQGRCASAVEALAVLLRAGDTPAAVDSRALHAIGKVHTELEFMWLRMYWLQGARHDALHAGFWAPAVAALERTFWELESGLRHVLDVLHKLTRSAAASAADGLSKRTYDMLEYHLGDRMQARADHDARVGHDAYGKLEPEDRPVDRPAFSTASPLPRDLTPIVAEVQAWRSAFQAAVAGAPAPSKRVKTAAGGHKKSKKKHKKSKKKRDTQPTS